LVAELPEVGDLTWPQLEAWAVAMRNDLPGAAIAAALEDVQARLIDEVCGPKWLPVRELPAPFGCPGCGVMSDFARKGMRTRLRRFDTAAGIVHVRLAHVGCRSCGRVFAPLLLMLDLSGKRRTDRLSVELAELASQMSFARAGSIARRFGLPGSAGRAHHAVADIAPRLESVGDPDAGGPARADVVVLDGTGMRASKRRLGVDCNIALGITGRSGPRRRRRADTALLGLTLGQSWQAMAPQLRSLEPPAMVVVDGEVAITTLAESVWPDVPIQRCWWHLPRALRWALYADKADHRWANDKRVELVELLRRSARDHLTPAQALAAYDNFRANVDGHHAASELLDSAREQVFTCLRPDLKLRLAALGGPEMGSGVLERVMRELNARTDIGGSRWSVPGLKDLITIQLARITDHPSWSRLQAITHPPNAIRFNITTAKFNAG
jgi:hypothetical protein